MVKNTNKIIVFIFFLTNAIVYSQTPGFNYQALISDTSDIQIPGSDVTQNNRPLDLENIILRFSIEDADEILYIETHNITTDENGMVSAIVGEGTPITSTFDQIIWDGELKLLTVEINILNNNEGFKFLDTQKILYLPHPTSGSNIAIVNDITNLTPPLNVGDIVWVKHYGENELPSLIIWDGDNWVPTSNDNDPTNELKLMVVADNAERDALFPNPNTGDQVWKEAVPCIDVFDGTNWVSINTNDTPISPNTFTNGLNQNSFDVKLGGTLIEPTLLTTSNTNTLAIKELEDSNLADDEIVRIEKTTGILRTSTVSSILNQEEAIIFASDEQLLFPTPLPITDPKKIDVYRNGVKIDFNVINTTTIKLEDDAICYENDKIRIVQLH